MLPYTQTLGNNFAEEHSHLTSLGAQPLSSLSLFASLSPYSGPWSVVFLLPKYFLTFLPGIFDCHLELIVTCHLKPGPGGWDCFWGLQRRQWPLPMSFCITNRQLGNCWFLMASMKAKVLIPLHWSQFSSYQLLKGKHTGFLALWIGRGLITILSVQTAVE